MGITILSLLLHCIVFILCSMMRVELNVEAMETVTMQTPLIHGYQFTTVASDV